MFSVQENLVFWALWAATLVVIVHQTIKASTSTTGILGFVPPLCMMFAYFYIVQAGIVAISLSDRLTPTYLALGQAVALLSLIGALWGWYKGSRGSVRSDPNERVIENPQALWYLGIITILIGIVGEYTFFAARAEVESGYWYMLF